jgi:hypothetical protein
MSAIGDAGIGGDTAQFEITLFPGDYFVDGRGSDDAHAFFEPLHISPRE